LLRHHTVSRHHARLNVIESRLWLTDLGSTNGTQLNGSPISPRKPQPLALDQHFSVGAFTLAARARATGELFACEALGQTGAHQETVLDAGARTQPVSVRPISLGSQERLALGRAQDNDVVLNHPMVSRYHAELLRVGARLRLRDLKSVNGVYVDGQRVSGEVQLRDGAQIQVGPYGFTVEGLDLRRQAEEGLNLEARNVNQQVSRQVNLLQNICLSVKPMEFVAVVGMSGSGKTTLLNVLNGYRPATHGEVLVNGIDLYRNYDVYRNDMGYVPQKDIVHTELTPNTALDYVARLRMPRDTSRDERQRAVTEALQNLDLVERRDVPIGSLSGGQLKRVSIGVELLTKPRLFFLDEPTSGLDPGTEYEMMHLLRRMSDQGRTIVLVTHDLNEARLLCDQLVVMDAGQVLQQGAPASIHRAPRNARVADLVGIQNRFHGVWLGPADAPGWGLLRWTDDRNTDGSGTVLRVPDKGRLDPGQAVSWVIHGEGVQLLVTPAEQPNDFCASVAELRHLGEITLATLVLQLAPGASLQLTLSGPQRARLAVGQRACVRLDMALVHVMPVRQLR
jgi:ABC-type multidrug transport system ATPase subunit